MRFQNACVSLQNKDYPDKWSDIATHVGLADAACAKQIWIGMLDMCPGLAAKNDTLQSLHSKARLLFEASC